MTKVKVTLLSKTKDADDVIYSAFKQCWSNEPVDKLWERLKKGEVKKSEVTDFLSKMVNTPHKSPLEHASYTFAVDGISRACSHQLVRHRIASFSQRSQKYVDESNFEYVTPDSIKKWPNIHLRYKYLMDEIREIYKAFVSMGIPKEDARFILPNATVTQLVFTMNVRELIHFLGLRLCNRAQWEIRELARQVLEILRRELPVVFNYVGPQCEMLGYCPERKSCGRKTFR